MENSCAGATANTSCLAVAHPTDTLAMNLYMKGFCT